MLALNVSLAERSYPIYIGQHLLHQAARIVQHLAQKKVAIVSNETVAPLYLKTLSDALKAVDVNVIPIILPDGEQFKTAETLNLIFTALLENKCERKTTLIALGGGVIGDITGYAAASYLRGVPFIQIPTTLLAQVDSSVGGKTGINHPLGKNMIGAFYQPVAVLIDVNTLATLPDRELRAGLAEVIKYGLIEDLEFFIWLEENIERLLARDANALTFAIERSCLSKADVVAADEREAGRRMLLNLGHTFGHAIETGLGYGVWLHGEAVAAGTIMAADLSCRLGMLKEQDVARIKKLFVRAGLPILGAKLGADTYLDLMSHDKKMEQGKLQFILLQKIGSAIVKNDVPATALLATLNNCVSHE